MSFTAEGKNLQLIGLLCNIEIVNTVGELKKKNQHQKNCKVII